jgi:3-oxoadipate enol-lactonase
VTRDTSAIISGLLLAALQTSAPGREAQNPARSSLVQAALDNGIRLAYEERGAGEPVVFVHACCFTDWFKPLLAEPSLTGRYRLVSYHRIGYGASSRLAGPVSIAQQAGQLRSLMRHLGIRRAHIVGHSSGGDIALQFALDAPEMVASLALLEPALPSTGGGPLPGTSTSSFAATAVTRFRGGDSAGAMDIFLRGVAGSAYRGVLDRVLPAAFDQAVVGAETFFGQELPAVQQWSFSRDQASRVTQPTLAVIGEKSPEVSSIWSERHQKLLDWLPRSQGFVLPGATHLLHLQNPRGMAERLAAFFADHEIGARDEQ